MLSLVGLLFCGDASFAAISVEEAYRAIPHRYTPFESKIGQDEPEGCCLSPGILSAIEFGNC